MSSAFHSSYTTELPLSEEDRSDLHGTITMFLALSFLFSTAIVVVMGVIGGIVFLFLTPVEGFVGRATYTAAALYLPFLCMCVVCLLKYIDIKRGKKLRFTTYDYEIKEKGKRSNSTRLIIKDNKKRKMDISEDIAPKIIVGQPLTIEITPVSKTLLFISHGEDNLLPK